MRLVRYKTPTKKQHHKPAESAERNNVKKNDPHNNRPRGRGREYNQQRKQMNLLIPFTNQSEAFTHGVEFGRLLQQMQDGKEQISNSGFPIRVENKEVVKNACEVYGYIPIFGSEYFGEWVEFLTVKKVANSN